jgi:hypothetical protein
MRNEAKPHENDYKHTLPAWPQASLGQDLSNYTKLVDLLSWFCSPSSAGSLRGEVQQFTARRRSPLFRTVETNGSSVVSVH